MCHRRPDGTASFKTKSLHKPNLNLARAAMSLNECNLGEVDGGICSNLTIFDKMINGLEIILLSICCHLDPSIGIAPF